MGVMIVKNRANMNSDTGIGYISCPRCGKIYMKVCSINTLVICPRCGSRVHTYYMDNILVQVPEEVLKDGDAADNMLKFFGKVKEKAAEVPWEEETSHS